MSLLFHVSSTFNRMRRRFPALLRIILVSCMIAVGAAIAHSGYYGATAGLQELSEQIVVKVFLDVENTAEDDKRISERIAAMPEVAEIQVNSADEALEEFVAKYGRPSENLMPGNPFPTTITAMVQHRYRTTEVLNRVTKDCRRIPGVEDAQFRTGFVDAVNERMRRNTAIWLAAGIVIVIIFFAMLHYTVKQHSGIDPNKAQVLTLMGARKSFIAAPDILFNITAILFGIAAGCGLVFLAREQLAEYTPWVNSINQDAIIPVLARLSAPVY